MQEIPIMEAVVRDAMTHGHQWIGCLWDKNTGYVVEVLGVVCLNLVIEAGSERDAAVLFDATAGTIGG